MNVISTQLISGGLSGLADRPLPGPSPSLEDFQATLTRARGAKTDATALRDAATELVSSAFLRPVFAQLRESTLAAGPFKPGTAEKRFGPLLDQHLADRVSKASSLDLVDVIVNRLSQIAGLDATMNKEPTYA